jgi:pimeloyl-ACP methyl ester carboxylesterase
MPNLNQQFQLLGGYRLGFDEYGPPAGKPLLYFHGAPSARLEFLLFGDEALLQSLNVRLIAVDRPGMGLSDFQPDRCLLDWPQAVLALADSLNLERFSILAYSLGGPYGLACAYAIPDRLTKVGIVSGAALFTESDLMQNINQGTRRYLNLPRENPPAAKVFLWMMSFMARFAPKLMVANMRSLLPSPDRSVVSDPAMQSGFIDMLREALRQGTRGAFHESLLAVTEWGFRLQDIHQPIHLWHGEMDQNIPVDMARHAASAIPQCEAKFYPNEGHLSLFKKYAAEIIGALVE